MDVITRHRLSHLDLEPGCLDARPLPEQLRHIYRAFLEHVPYENLSDHLAVERAPSDPEQWPRATDTVLRENKSAGLGGTSFSLSYALRDIFRGLGANAHCTLGYNLVTERAHAAVLVYQEGQPLIFDPALLMCDGMAVRPMSCLEDPLGRFTLAPRQGPTLTMTLEMAASLAGERENEDAVTLSGGPMHDVLAAAGSPCARAIYSVLPLPAPPQSFRQAWVASFFRGRRMPLRMARRKGDTIYRYGERPGTIEVLEPDGRRELQVAADPIEQLHELFGVAEASLVAWFRR